MNGWDPLAAIGMVAAGGIAAVASGRWTAPWALWLLLKIRYDLVVLGGSNLPRRGPALLVANHVTWMDGFLLMAALPRVASFLVNAAILDQVGLNWLGRWYRIIPTPASGPKAQRAAIERARDALKAGQLVALFPEGQLSRNGRLGRFLRGLELMARSQPHCVIVPVCLENLWGSMFSFSGGRFWKRPHGRRRRVIVSVGPPLRHDATTFEARQAVLEAGVRGRAWWRSVDPQGEAASAALIAHDATTSWDGNADPTPLACWIHPTLGKLAGESPDFARDEIRQRGRQPGTVGQAWIGVALRVVDNQNRVLGPGMIGRIQALTVATIPIATSTEGWVETGREGTLDADGFLTLVDSTEQGEVESRRLHA
jgi:1-acyl-sn-glycerol-3-phosphate acyltransferase